MIQHILLPPRAPYTCNKHRWVHTEINTNKSYKNYLAQVIKMVMIFCLYDQTLDKVFVCTYVYGICMYAHMCADVLAQVAWVEARVWGYILSIHSCLIVWSKGSHRTWWSLCFSQDQLTRKCLKYSCPPLTQVLRARAHPSISSFDRAVDWSSGPHVCPASTLPTEPSPQPQKFILKLEVSKDLKRHGFVHKRC